MTSDVPEEAVGMGQLDLVAYGISEFVGCSGEVLKDDHGIAVKALCTLSLAWIPQHSRESPRGSARRSCNAVLGFEAMLSR